jgi:hypothetical protein
VPAPAAAGSLPAPYWDIDTGFASLLMLLTAVDAGLGACFFGFPVERMDGYRAAFGVPAHFTPTGAISIGYSDEPPSDLRSRRKPETETVYRGPLGPASRVKTAQESSSPLDREFHRCGGRDAWPGTTARSAKIFFIYPERAVVLPPAHHRTGPAPACPVAGWRATLLALAFQAEMLYAWLITAAITSGYWKQLTKTGKTDTWKMVRGT